MSEQKSSGQIAHNPYLIVQNISKSFGAQPVLSHVYFTANEGEFVSILGPSGSGKSTLLRVIAGLESPDDGEVVCDNATYFSASLSVRRPVEQRDIGMVFQDFGLWPHLTALDHVTFPLVSRKHRGHLQLSKREIKEQAMAALQMFRMEEFANKKPHQLSGGQQQRVAFARAVVARPSLVLLDEAFSALDPQLRVEVRPELVGILRDHRMTVLNVTHDQEEAMAISDRVLVLHQGSQLQFASPSDLYDKPANERVASFVGKGRLIPVELDEKSIRFPNGQQLRQPVQSELAHLKAYLLIRPEFMRIIDPEEKTHEALPEGTLHDKPDLLFWRGRVTRQTSLVGRTEVVADIDGIGELSFYHHERLALGDMIELQVQMKRPHIIFGS